MVKLFFCLFYDIDIYRIKDLVETFCKKRKIYSVAFACRMTDKTVPHVRFMCYIVLIPVMLTKGNIHSVEMTVLMNTVKRRV